MEDTKIVEMYWERSENAIAETEKKYGRYCYKIAFNILSNELDSQECVNDTYLKAWEAMPPHKPERLSAFLGKITRNVALNRYQRDRAQKRAAHAEVIYEEVAEFIPCDSGDISDELALKNAINSFLASLSKNVRIVFVQRYWYMCSVKEIALQRGMTESNVKVTLMRTRKKFKEHLEKEGITL